MNEKWNEPTPVQPTLREINWNNVPIWAWPAPRPERARFDAGVIEQRRAGQEQLRAQRLARKRLGNANGMMLLWHALMYVIVIGATLLGTVAGKLEAFQGAGYLLFGAVSPVLVLLWKKPRYYRTHVFARRRTPSFALVLLWLVLLLGIQGAADLLQRLLSPLFTMFGDGDSALTELDGSWQMIVYTAVLAPIGEEILFRGLLLRTAQPYGRRLAIFTSAMFFALMHGNLTQGVFAFGFGLLAAYITLEYSIVWSILLHTINNSLLAYGLNALLQTMMPVDQLVTLLAVFYLPLLALIVLLIVKRRAIGSYLRQERPLGIWKNAYFTSPWTIVALVVFGLTAIFSLVCMGI